MEVDSGDDEGDYQPDRKRDGDKLCSLKILFTGLSLERGLFYMATWVFTSNAFYADKREKLRSFFYYEKKGKWNKSKIAYSD